MILFLVLTTALILRIINLNQSLWLDEAINVVYSQNYNFWDFLTVYSLGDFHPPLHFAILWLWTRIFGISEISVRFPSVIFGIITVWLTFLIAKNLFSKKVALVAAVILAFNPLHVYFSQEARMYSLAAFAVALSFWSLINILNAKKSALLIYIFSVVLILYSDYLAYFVLPAQLFYVAWLEKKKLTKVVSSMLLGGLFWIPWLFIFPLQLKVGQSSAISIPGWASVVGGANFKELALLAVKSIVGRVSFDNKYIYSGITAPILLLYGLIFLKAIKDLTKEIKLLLLWVIAPTCLAFLISFYVPIFAYFRMIFILPGLAILMARGIMEFGEKLPKIITFFILIISLIFLLLYYLNPKFQREDWKGVLGMVKEKRVTTLFEDSNIPAPAKYYGCRSCVPALKNFPAKDKSDIYNLDQLLTNTSNVYLFDYLVEISDKSRLTAKELERLGYKLVNTHNFNGVGFVYEYSK